MSYKFTKELHKGDTGDEVKALQEFIIEIHFENVMTADGMKTVVADGEFGDITAEAVESIKAKAFDYISTEYIRQKFQYWYNKPIDEAWLEVDSNVNPLFGLFLEHFQEVQDYLHVTMQGLDLTPDPQPVAPEESTQDQLIAKVIEIENAEVGTRENPIGSNSGERVNEYINIGTDGEIKHGGISWCNAFQNWGVKTGADAFNLDYLLTYSVYTPTTVEEGKKKGIAIKNPTKDQIKVGDWGFVHSIERGGGTSISSVHHIYLITGFKGNNVLTDEGNTGNGGEINGDGTYNRIRPINKTHCWCIVRWADLYK